MFDGKLSQGQPSGPRIQGIVKCVSRLFTEFAFLDAKRLQGQTAGCGPEQAYVANALASHVFHVLLHAEADSMSGPIVRTGTTPEFWKNWDRAFGGKKNATGGDKAPAKPAGTAAETKVVKKASKKAAKKSK